MVASLDDMAMVGFSFGFPVDERIQDIVDLIPVSAGTRPSKKTGYATVPGWPRPPA